MHIKKQGKAYRFALFCLQEHYLEIIKEWLTIKTVFDKIYLIRHQIMKVYFRYGLNF